VLASSDRNNIETSGKGKINYSEAFQNMLLLVKIGRTTANFFLTGSWFAGTYAGFSIHRVSCHIHNTSGSQLMRSLLVHHEALKASLARPDTVSIVSVQMRGIHRFTSARTSRMAMRCLDLFSSVIMAFTW
jgi:hypothetical protein